jgi:hypothetical protein
MSILDELLSKLRSRDSNLTPNTGLPGISNPNDILSKLQSQNNNLTHDTGLPGLPGTSNPDDIKTYPINDIMKSGKFTAFERKQEYRRRGKSPSGVIDGVYNDPVFLSNQSVAVFHFQFKKSQLSTNMNKAWISLKIFSSTHLEDHPKSQKRDNEAF